MSKESPNHQQDYKSTTAGFTSNNNQTARTRNVEIDPIELSEHSQRSSVLIHSQSTRKFNRQRLNQKVRFQDGKKGFKSDRPYMSHSTLPKTKPQVDNSKLISIEGHHNRSSHFEKSQKLVNESAKQTAIRRK